jgi:hypothetical protein
MKIDKSTFILLSIFIGSFAVYQITGAVNIVWGDQPVSFSEVVKSTTWSHAFSINQSDEFFGVFAFGGVLVIAYLFARSTMMRAVLLGIAVVTPMIQIGIVMGGLMLVGPLIIYSVFAGQLDGESYQEQMPQAAAAGLWMLGCFLLGMYQAFQVRRERKIETAQQDADDQLPARLESEIS